MCNQMENLDLGNSIVETILIIVQTHANRMTKMRVFRKLDFSVNYCKILSGLIVSFACKIYTYERFF